MSNDAYISAGYQATYAGSYSLDGTLVDGTHHAGPNATGAPGSTIALSAIWDYGSPIAVTQFDYSVEWAGTLTHTFDWSLDGTSWTNIGLVADATNNGNTPAWSDKTVSLSITARYLRYSAQGNGFGPSGTAFISIGNIAPTPSSAPIFYFGAATIQGVGVLTPVPTRSLKALAALSGVGLVQGTGKAATVGTSTLTGVGRLSPAPVRGVAGQATVQGVGTLDATHALLTPAVASGYQATSGFTYAPTLIDSDLHDGPVDSGSVGGTVSLTAVIDLNAPMLVGSLDWSVLWAGVLTQTFDYSLDSISWFPLSVPAISDDHAGVGLWADPSYTLPSPITARYLRYSATDTASGGNTPTVEIGSVASNQNSAECQSTQDIAASPPKTVTGTYPEASYNTTVSFPIPAGCTCTGWSLISDYAGSGSPFGRLFFTVTIPGTSYSHTDDVAPSTASPVSWAIGTPPFDTAYVTAKAGSVITFNLFLFNEGVNYSFTNFKLVTTCSCAASVKLSASVYDDILCVAWIDSAGGVRHARHLSPRHYIGDGTHGWDSVETIEASGCDNVGLAFLPNGRLYLTYKKGADNVYRFNEQIGRSGEWSATATPDPDNTGISANGIGKAQTFRIRSSGSTFQFAQCRDCLGAKWTTEKQVFTADSPTAGAVWAENQYIALYSVQDGKVRWKRDPNFSLVIADHDAGFTGYKVGGMCYTTAGVLVAPLWQIVSQRTVIARSRDRGDHWEKDGSYETHIPKLSRPPVAVNVEDAALVVWQVGDVPAFTGSLDGGRHWS